MERNGDIRGFCERFWNSLFSSIAETRLLTRYERRVYVYLWHHVDVRTRVYEKPLALSSIARRLECSEASLTRVLDGLCRKGFARHLEPRSRRPLRLALNPLLVEAAFDQTKHHYPPSAR